MRTTEPVPGNVIPGREADAPQGQSSGSCTHPMGRPFPSTQMVHEILRALGIVTCVNCGQTRRVYTKRSGIIEP